MSNINGFLFFHKLQEILYGVRVADLKIFLYEEGHSGVCVFFMIKYRTGMCKSFIILFMYRFDQGVMSITLNILSSAISSACTAYLCRAAKNTQM